MMKDIKILVGADEIHDFTRKLWRSDLFQKSHDEGGLVHQAVEQFSGLPRFFFRPSDDIENPHFSAWWGGIQMREYDNPAIHDLYYLHEIWHAGTMAHMKNMTYDNFSRKMIDNELEASVVSEMLVYYELPELRKQTFPYRIFVDKFLFPNGYQNEPDPVALDRWRRNPGCLMETLKLERRDVMMSQTPHTENDVEFWIQKFTHQNECWAHLWYASYNKVETTMVDLIADCKTMGRRDAMDKFMNWLQSDEISMGEAIPFPLEARAFIGIYRLNKYLYGQTFARNAAPGAKPVSYVDPGMPAGAPASTMG